MKLLLLHIPYHDPRQSRIIMQKERVTQTKQVQGEKINKTKQNTQKNLLLFSSLPPQSYIIYSQSIRSLVPVIGMMDGSTSAAAREDTAMHHSAGKNNGVNKAAGQCGGQESQGNSLLVGKNQTALHWRVWNTAWGVCTPCGPACWDLIKRGDRQLQEGKIFSAWVLVFFTGVKAIVVVP